MRGRAPLALLVLAVTAATSLGGCGGKPSTGVGRNGILWLSWTVRGQMVSDTSCNGVDHLNLTMESGAGALTIEPIPCLRGLGWEYDGLPEGTSLVILDGYDVHGAVTLEGSSTVAVGPTRAATPAPIDLLALH